RPRPAPPCAPPAPPGGAPPPPAPRAPLRPEDRDGPQRPRGERPVDQGIPQALGPAAHRLTDHAPPAAPAQQAKSFCRRAGVVEVTEAEAKLILRQLQRLIKVHDIDMACMGLDVDRLPVRVTAHGSRIDLVGEREYPDNMMVCYQFDNNKVLIYEDRGWTHYGMDGVDSGNAFYGTQGYMIFSRRGYFQVYLDRKGTRGPGL